MDYKRPRGTYDLYYDKARLYEYIINEIVQLVKNANYTYINTPIFEHKQLFIRSLGENSDIVTKEFYSFFDKKNRELVLRPENTISVVRAVIENNLTYTNTLPLRLFYHGPIFRYERPQNNRYRQFVQFGIEKIGIKSIYEQIEVLLIGKKIFDLFNLSDEINLEINYLGTSETIRNWINLLKPYFSKYIDQLDELNLSRLNKNPLRILDDKKYANLEFVKNAPKIETVYSSQEADELNQIIDLLNSLNIKFTLNKNLVRGLDYYSGLVFEFKTTTDNTVLAGGKYSHLFSELNSSDLDCIGFSLGVERLMNLLEEKQLKIDQKLDLYLAPIQINKTFTFELMNFFRSFNISCITDWNISDLNKHLKQANKLNPRFVLVYGQKELETNTYLLKDFVNKTQSNLDKKSVADLLISYRK